MDRGKGVVEADLGVATADTGPAKAFPVVIALVVALAASVVGVFNDYAGFALLGGCMAWFVYRHIESVADVIGLLFLVFCLAPLVRRLHDFRSGWVPGSVLLVAPYVLYLPLIPGLVARLRQLRRWELAPMLVILGTIFFSLIVGLLNLGFVPACMSLFEWGSGPLVAMYILLSDHELSYRRLMGWLTGLALVESIYAIVQWVVAPAWDTQWLMDSHMFDSMGDPKPFMMRVWGTLNSTGPLAVFLFWYCTLALGQKRFMLVGPLALAAIILTQVRAAMVTMVVAVAVLFAMADGFRLRAARNLVVCLVLGGLLAAPFSDRMQGVFDRVATMGKLGGDTSYMDRQHLADMATAAILEHPLGYGLGVDGRAARTTGAGFGGTIDNGFFAMALCLGWAGAVAYMCSYLVMVGCGTLGQGRKKPGVIQFGVAAIALVFANIFGSGFSDFVGVITWVSGASCYRWMVARAPASISAEA